MIRMNRTDPLQNLQWQGNSRAMYGAILNGVPPMFRGSVKKSIVKWVVQHHIQVVTETLVFQAVNEIAPPDLARKRILPELEKLKTNA